jgi:chromate transporter
MNPSTNPISIKDVFMVFLKLGTLGFGGPLAHMAMMRKEVVEKKKWLSEQEFMDLVGATNLIPGPNSTELVIHIGYRMAGWPGLIVAGLTFILPAFFCVLALAVAYVSYGDLPRLEPILAGIRPVIIVIVFEALIKFRKSAIPGFSTAMVALVALVLTIMNVNEILIILGLGALYSCFFNRSLKSIFIFPLINIPSVLAPITSNSIFYFFLKIGSVLFGSGYVLLAFLQSELVDQRMWLTQKQLLDAITVGQITPGPVFTTATFIGYLLKSYEGALLATLGIFLPSFFFVALSAPFLKKMRASIGISKFIDGVNAVSFALLLKVTFDLSKTGFASIPTYLIGLVSLILIFRFKQLNSVWLILCAGILGFLFL